MPKIPFFENLTQPVEPWLRETDILVPCPVELGGFKDKRRGDYLFRK